MNLDQIVLFSESIDKKYLILKKDGLDQFRGVILFLRNDLQYDMAQLHSKSRLNLYVRFKIKQQIEKWTIPQMKHMMEKIDKYEREGFVDHEQ